MLILPIKPAVSYNLGDVLSVWLDNNDNQTSFVHKPTNPLLFVLPKPDFTSNDCYNELQRLQSYRTTICNVLLQPNSHVAVIGTNNNSTTIPTDSTTTSSSILDDLYEYHAILLEFEKHGFPSIDDEMIPIYIPWKESLLSSLSSSSSSTSNKKGKIHTNTSSSAQHNNNQCELHSSLVWERVCIMYNIIALLTQYIENCSKNDRNQCKIAVQLCQQAGSIVTVLKELVSTQQHYITTIDLSTSVLTFYEKLFLAEAQYNIYRMALLNDTTNTNKIDYKTIAILAQSASSLYNDALQSVTLDARIQSELGSSDNTSTTSSSIAIEWGTYCKINSMILSCLVQYNQSIYHKELYQYGKEIIHLRECLQKLKVVQIFFKSLKSTTTTTYNAEEKQITELIIVVQDRLQLIEIDNYKIYQDIIPTTVPEILGKQLAKFSNTLPQCMIQTKIKLFTFL